jgi:hypothetical protein
MKLELLSSFLKRERGQIVFEKGLFSFAKYQKYWVLFGLIVDETHSTFNIPKWMLERLSSIQPQND